MYTNTHLTQAVAREAIEYRVRDAELLRKSRTVSRTPRTRAPRRLSLSRRAAHRLA
ncbi:hypothetical protein [Solicola gregarius]|uniref:Uncharacterized protein n=1 Tax=Solicola gregarius TaxID=2908642 RepID=A0AA46YKB1_9ACTN|nr:hypothetical protein [Solicola gregarius]UYM05565.1 hypothetical protein L0C25_00305 [Solicola gregarius]